MIEIIIYSLENLFKNIDEVKDKEEFFYELARGGEGADYYIGLITDFEPENNNIILADCHKPKLYEWHLNKESICVDGFLVFQLWAHDEDFRVFRVDNINEVEKIILSGMGIYNMFINDIVVLENGIRKQYYINDKNGNRVGYQQFEQTKYTNLTFDYYIEWNEDRS